MSRILLDINSVVPYFVRGWLSGIGRTTKSLVEAMNALEDIPHEILLYSQNMKGIGGQNLKSHFANKHLYLPHREKYNKLLGILPIRELLSHYDLCHIPHNFAYVKHPEKTIITLHDTLYFSYPEDNLNHQFARNNYPHLARTCKGIITCSESSKSDIVKYMDVDPAKIVVTPWGVDTTLFHPAEQKQDFAPYFLAVSCSNGRKNTINVVKSYLELSKNNPIHDLVLVWGNPSNEVLSMIDSSSIRDKVKILSHISDAELVELYQQASCTFFPSRYEGFGLPVLESMACGTPVVTCDNSSLPEVGGNAALYVNPDDISSMSGIMEKFENNPHFKSELATQCLNQASKFTWRKCAQQTIQAYTYFLAQ